MTTSHKNRLNSLQVTCSKDWSFFYLPAYRKFTEELHLSFISVLEDNAGQQQRETGHQLLLSIFNVHEILKDDRRSFIAVINVPSSLLNINQPETGTESPHLKLIIKIPKEKNRRKWIRFTTLYRNSEVRKTFSNLLQMKEIGLKCNEPLLFAEKRKAGKVVDSFIIYSYIEGNPVDRKGYYILLDEMKKLHNKGYIHGDFHSMNFLQSDEDVYFLDTSLRLNIFASFGRCYEMVYFLKSKCTVDELKKLHLDYIKKNYGKLSLTVAFAYSKWMQFRKKVKLFFRKRRL